MNNSFRNELVSTFINLVKISSTTGQVDDFRNYLKNFFTREGFQVMEDKFENLFIYTKEFNPKKSLLLSAHIDTVQPGENIKPQVKGNFIKSDGTTILAADPKAGIAAILMMIQELKRKGKKLKNLEFVFSTNEEDGDHTLNHAKVKSKKAIVFDNSTWINEVIIQCPFAQVFLIKVTGKEVYAQKHYDQGRNAIAAMAEIIKRLPWGFYKKNCVANTGIISGGRSTTLVPGEAVLKGNIYCIDKKDLDAYIAKIKKTTQQVDKLFRTKTKLEILENYAGSPRGLNKNLIKEITPYYERNNVKVNWVKKLLVGPDNCLAEKNVAAINIGIGYQGCHTKAERQSIPQLIKLTQILVDYIGENYTD